ncbi:MAG: DUF2905 domain-containing protein [Anaerolineae bacterium]|nr:DUF2905 domain-containing protein [Anaerolineae bacterium]MDW8100952.1 DUF2905 domain-containing protein [Anaerolineae bacterium]
MLNEMARWLIFVGGAMVVIGLLLLLAGRLPGLGRLPGDILIQKGNFTFFAPLGTMLLLSIVLTILLNLVIRLLR